MLPADGGFHRNFCKLFVAFVLHELAQLHVVAVCVNKCHVVRAVTHHLSRGLKSPCAGIRGNRLGLPFCHEGAILLVGREVGLEIDGQRVMAAVDFRDE